jgi:hypothetical protein
MLQQTFLVKMFPWYGAYYMQGQRAYAKIAYTIDFYTFV